MPNLNKSKVYNLCDSIETHTKIMQDHYMGHRKPEYLMQKKNDGLEI